MDFGGNLLASASTKGTIIRVFLLDGSKTCVQEVRRGIDNASIMSINFNLTGQLMGVSSDSGTVHVFKMKEHFVSDETVSGSTVSKESQILNSDEKNKNNKKSKLRFLRRAVSYFKSEWSFVNLRVKERNVLMDFNKDSTDVIIYVKHGKIYRASFELDPKGKKTLFKLKSKVNLVYGNITQL